MDSAALDLCSPCVEWTKVMLPAVRASGGSASRDCPQCGLLIVTGEPACASPEVAVAA